jgi:hypothetical protein
MVHRLNRIPCVWGRLSPASGLKADLRISL